MASTSTTREQPPWTAPQPRTDKQLPPLKIYNSLTRTKTPFVPVGPDGSVTWYSCGPTTYDEAHLGHARNYVTIDIVRRILADYFNFKVKFVMNITDVDDKIILRARQQHLLAKFKSEHEVSASSPAPSAVQDTAKAAFAYYVKKNLPLLPEDVSPESFSSQSKAAYKRVLDGLALDEASPAPGDKEAKLKMHMNTAGAAAEALKDTSLSSTDFYDKVSDVMLPYLDSLHGANIDSDDYTIFTKLTQKFENLFFEDMRSLNVEDPDVLTRVTEYVPQIVKFVEKIISNGFGYQTPDGSVYFDIEAFEKGGHQYARLEPWNRNDKALQADGEGSLTKATVKRNENDFALWKASKPGEPAWPSPWGRGRPGWHIECSAMASEVLGKEIDVHSGGADLRFPHHDNELAQSEAYWTASGNRVQWVNYFIHMGHLSIAGMKMSKSLKNFTTIKAALAQPEWTSRSLRICFLLGAWQDGIEVTEELLKATHSWENKVHNFFLKAVDVAKNPKGATTPNDTDKQLLESLEKAKKEVDAGLCDSFNTAAAMKALSDLITDFNLAKDMSDETVLTMARWVTRIVTIFGLDAQGDLNQADRVGWAGVEIPAAAEPYVNSVAQFRDQIRQRAIAKTLDASAVKELASSASALPKVEESDEAWPYSQVADNFKADVSKLAAQDAATVEYLKLCDQLRDTHLWNLGIYLEDREPPLPAMVRPVDRALLETRAQREQEVSAKAAAKARREAEEAERKRLLEEKARTSHLDMFRTAEYTEWDADGLPTKDAEGKEVAKSKRKKLVKEWERQKKLHEEWKAKQAA